MAIFNLNINGKMREVDVDPSTPMLWVLRDHLRLLGTKYGCGIALCGTCTVHLNGNPARSCVITIDQAQGSEVVTIEGLSEDGSHPVQEAWKEIDVPQCGYCQSGQIMTAAAFLGRNSDPSEEEIREAMHGNICRCASYHRIYQAVELAAKNMQSS